MEKQWKNSESRFLLATFFSDVDRLYEIKSAPGVADHQLYGVNSSENCEYSALRPLSPRLLERTAGEGDGFSFLEISTISRAGAQMLPATLAHNDIPLLSGTDPPRSIMETHGTFLFPYIGAQLRKNLIPWAMMMPWYDKESRNRRVFGIQERRDPEGGLIGIVGVYGYYDRARKVKEIHYELHPTYWHRGALKCKVRPFCIFSDRR